MKNLGRTIILFILFIFPLSINAGVVASVDSSRVQVGDVVTLNLTLSGEDIKKPALFSICESDIISTSSKTSIQIVNLNYEKNYVLSYSFSPKKSCTIEPIEVEIGGKKEKTEAIKVVVAPFQKSAEDDFDLTLTLDKKSVYVGEPFTMTLVLKQKNSAKVVDSKFLAPDLKGFWVKGESQPKRYSSGDYMITTISYSLCAQREGTLAIPSAQMKIATRVNTRESWSSFSPSVKWRSYFSNRLKVEAKALPKGLNLVGDFSIDVLVDKIKVNQNEAVNLTLFVDGKGNLEDIKSFKPYIQNVSVFDEKIEIKVNKLTQKIAFVADENFTIPSFKIEYFDIKTKKSKAVFTKAIKVEVVGSKKREVLVKRDTEVNSTLQTPTIVKTERSVVEIILVFIAGLVVGVLVVFYRPWTYLKREKSISLKNPKLLLTKLIAYKDDKEVAEIVEALEKNIYANAKIEIDKKSLKECMKKYSIKS